MSTPARNKLPICANAPVASQPAVLRDEPSFEKATSQKLNENSTDIMYSVKTVPLVWITIPKDGVRLAATLWLPEAKTAGEAAQEKHSFPALLEILPYNRMDYTKERDCLHYPLLASHGFAGIRVDMRGTGDSGGLYFDEYEKQEQDDCCDVIEWISNQAWCSGEVGMFGKSWGGFNALQVAARQPPALKAVISTYSTDDRYSDDIHYMGGCVMGVSGLSWASTMAVWNARPPEPLSVGKSWKQMWLNRLHQSNEPWIHRWLSHQSRDHYWKHGSICEDYKQIKCPVLLIGGWADLYSNAVFRMVQNLTCPVRAVIGPWAHYWTGQGGTPGPNIDHVDVFLRWFDFHLKGIDNGVMKEPAMVIYMRDGIKMPSCVSDIHTWPGKWICEDNWPSTNVSDERFTLDMRLEQLLPLTTSARASAENERSSVSRSTRWVISCGLDGGIPMASSSADLPSDQKCDDSTSLHWDSIPLGRAVDVLGFPLVNLQFSCDKHCGIIAVRLCDVFPDGSSTLITRAVFNLSHRNGHNPDSIADLVPDKIYSITVKLDATGYVVAAGHKIRLALSPTYWPVVWPPAVPTCLTIHAGELLLPVRVASKETLERDVQMRELKPRNDSWLTLVVEKLRKAKFECTSYLDPEHNSYKINIEDDRGSVLFKDTGTFRDETRREAYTITNTERGPKPTISIKHQLIMKKTTLPDKQLYQHTGTAEEIGIPGNDKENNQSQETLSKEEFFAWDTRVTHVSDMWSDEKHFHVRNNMTCYHGNDVVFDKTWEKAIERYYV